MKPSKYEMYIRLKVKVTGERNTLSRSSTKSKLGKGHPFR